MSTTALWSKAKTDFSHLKEQERFEHALDFKWLFYYLIGTIIKYRKEGNEYEIKIYL